jgi:hypothetical protein
VRKFAIALILTLSLLLSFASLASAELLFGVTAETGSPDLTMNYKGVYTAYGTDISATPNMITLTGDLNLFLIHIGAEYGTGNAGDGATFSEAMIKAGWEIGLPIVSVQLYGGYQAYTLTKSDSNSTPSLGDSAYWDLFVGLGLQASLANFSVYGNVNFPIYAQFSNGITDDDNASMNYLKVGVSYAPIPFVDLFVNYRKMDAESTVMKLASDGYNFGVKLSF